MNVRSTVLDHPRSTAETAPARPLAFRPRTLAARYRVLHLGLLLPATALILALVAWPIWKIGWISLHEIQLNEIMREIRKPLTLANYGRAVFTWDFAETLWITAKYVGISTVVALLIGLATALALNFHVRGRAVLRTIIISPWAVAPVFASIIWLFLLDGRLGLVNYLLLKVGIIAEPIDWIMSPSAALWAVIIAHVWKSYPFFAVMILAGLQSIPRNLYEAAQVDGAGPVRQFVDVTLPGLMQVITIAGVLSLLSSFRDVETILVMTKGGPARMTETLAVRIYNETFEYLDVGASSAMGMAGFVISLVSIYLLLRGQRRSFHR